MDCCENKNFFKDKEMFFVQTVQQYMDILG